MTPKELIAEVAYDTGLPQTQVDRTLTSLVAIVISNLAEGNEVWLKGLGKLIPRDRAERMARNPRTGEDALVPARRIITFKPAKAAKDAVGGLDE